MTARPKSLDGYRLLSKLGHGGFGEVWYAENAEGRGRAIKILHPQFISVSTVRARFEREARILLQLDHPGIVDIEVFSIEPQPYIGMEFLRGSTLKDMLEDRALDEAPLHMAQVLRINAQLCDAIAAAHEYGIVHRDLKPQNIVIVDENTLSLKILDFGIASLVNADIHSNTTLGRTIGSRMYMSPEQIRGERASPATDIFALGTLLFELCTLRRPWLHNAQGQPHYIGDVGIETGNGTKEVLERIIVGERPAMSLYRDDLPRALDDVLQIAWAVNPARRFSDVGAFGAAVSAALSASPTDTASLDSVADRTLSGSAFPSDTASFRSAPEPTAISSQAPTRVVQPSSESAGHLGRRLRAAAPFALTFAAGSLLTAVAPAVCAIAEPRRCPTVGVQHPVDARGPGGAGLARGLDGPPAPHPARGFGSSEKIRRNDNAATPCRPDESATGPPRARRATQGRRDGANQAARIGIAPNAPLGSRNPHCRRGERSRRRHHSPGEGPSPPPRTGSNQRDGANQRCHRRSGRARGGHRAARICPTLVLRF